MLRRKKSKMGKTHCFTCFKMRLHLRWSTTNFSQLPHMHTTISPEFWIVYIPMNTSTCIRTLKKRKSRVKAQKGKNGQNALFHLLQNAPTPALIYHDFLPTSTHAHNYITWVLDSLHPNEHVYMHYNIKKSEKVVLRRKKAKMGKTHCFTCFKMRLHLRWSTTIFSQLPHIRTTISPEFWIVYIPKNTSTSIRKLKKVEKVVLMRKKAKVGKTHCYTCFKMRLHLRWSTTIFSQLPHMRTTISPEFWIVYIPMNTSTCIRTFKRAKKSC